MTSTFVCSLCSLDHWSERFLIPMPGQGTLVLCAHTMAEIERTARLVQHGAATAADPCQPPDFPSRLIPGPSAEDSDR